MATFDQVQPASFRGVPFLVQEVTTNGGMKHVVHSFPNSNKQSVESLGVIPKSFSVTASITEDASGDLYYQRRDRLIQALDDTSRGIFVHPWFGKLNSIKVTSYSLVETFTAVGEAKFTIEFITDDSDGLPSRAQNTLPSIESESTALLDIISANVGDTFKVSSKYPENFTAAIDVLNNVIEAFNDNTNFLSVSAEEINTFTAELGAFQESITSLITNPQELADSITGLFNTVNGLYDTVESTFAVLLGFFPFAESAELPPNNTVGRTERNKNTKLIRGMMQAQSLILAYANAVQIDYPTLTDIEQAEETLETQYQQVIVNRDLPSETLNTLTEFRSEVQDFFNTEKITAGRIIDVFSSIIPVSTLTYQYYGSTALDQSVAELNQDLNTSFLRGDLQVITA